MSEVAIVAAITGGTSVLTSAITATVTWVVSRNSSAVELAKVMAENERLQQGNQEDERRNRQSTYHDFLDVLTRLFQLLGFEANAVEVEEVCDQYGHLLAGVLLFGPPSVRRGAYAVNEVYMEIVVAVENEESSHPDKPDRERWKNATTPLRDAFGHEVSALTHLMHADVTRGIADEPTA